MKTATEQRQYRKAIGLICRRLGRHGARLLFRAARDSSLRAFLGPHYSRLVAEAKAAIADHVALGAFERIIWPLVD